MLSFQVIWHNVKLTVHHTNIIYSKIHRRICTENRTNYFKVIATISERIAISATEMPYISKILFYVTLFT